MRILGGIRGDTADGYFRIAAPFSVLRYSSTPHEFKVRRPALGDVQEFDVLWLQRHCEPMAEVVAREFKDAGKPVIYDVDDWLFGIPPSWSCFSNYYERGTANPTALLVFHERLLRLADVVTCPTGPLAQRLRERLSQSPMEGAAVKGWETPPPVKVLPNCILQGDWDTVLPLKVDLKGPIIGWFGMEYHWDNLKQIAEVLDEALEAIDGHLVILGFPEAVACFPDRLAARTRVQAAVSWKNFGIMRRMISAFDVGLAWLEDTPFNRCKSSLKALQYGAAGVPVVASKTVYGEVMEHGRHGLLAEITEELGEAIYEMMVIVKGDLVANWREEVWRNHSYERQARRWLDVIEGAVGGETGD